MKDELDRETFLRFARNGAAAQLAVLDAQRSVIVRQFPDLEPARPAILAEPPNGRRRMNEDERAAVSKRMKAYWRKRRRAAAAKR